MRDRVGVRRSHGLLIGAAAAMALLVPTVTQAAPVLYGITFGDQLITIDTATGAGTVVGSLDSSMGAYGLGTVGTDLYTFDQTADLLRELDPATGDTLGSVALGIGNLIGEGAIDFRSDGTGFLTTASPGPNLYSFTTAGGGTLIGTTSQVIDGLAFDSTDTLYGLIQAGANLVTINQATGALTVVGPTGLGSGPVLGGLAFLDDQLYAVLSTATASSLYTLDPGTGLATLVGSVGIGGVSGIAFLDTESSPAPEPASVLLIGFGLAVAARRRLRAHRS
jgi:hypothetical protein